ncbi:MAG: class F sortase [Thermomicrobiales bacterium]
MRDFQRSYVLAAALILVGAAGFAFAGINLLTRPSPSSASDDAVLDSIGTVPPALETTSTVQELSIPKMPERAEEEGKQLVQKGYKQEGDSWLPSSDGDLTQGRNPGARKSPEPTLTSVPTPAEAGEPAPTPTPAPAGIDPVAIHIPKIDVFTDVIPVGTTPDGAMEAPGNYDDVGWWSPGARPGQIGRAVFAAHVDSPWGPAVFFRLDELQPGDEIIVGDGLSEQHYIVRGAATYRADAAPVEDIFGPSSEQELVLITCGGVFDRRSATYVHRRVVFAVLAEDDPYHAIDPVDAGVADS